MSDCELHPGQECTSPPDFGDNFWRDQLRTAADLTRRPPPLEARRGRASDKRSANRDARFKRKAAARKARY